MKKSGFLPSGSPGRFAANILVVTATAMAAWIVGLIWFAGAIAEGASSMDARRTDVIVVLTGGSERLDTGLALLAADKADRLFVSGVHPDVDAAALLRVAGLSQDAFACCITLGHTADDTIGNAAETAHWMRSQGLSSMRLVTANYHMMRSLLEFRMTMPEMEILPHPVFPPNVRLTEWWRWPGTASLIVTEYNKFLITLLRYMVKTAITR